MDATFSTSKSQSINQSINARFIGRRSKKSANSHLMQAYIESLIWFGSTRSKLLTFPNRSRSICGWTILSPPQTPKVQITENVQVLIS